MLRLYAPLKPENRAPGFDVIVLDEVQTITTNIALPEGAEFYFANARGESVRFRWADVVYISLKERGVKCE